MIISVIIKRSFSAQLALLLSYVSGTVGILGAPKAVVGSPPGQDVFCSCEAHNCNFNPVAGNVNFTIQKLRGAGNLPLPPGRCVNCLFVNSITHILSSASLSYRFQENATCACPEGSVLTVSTGPSNVLDVNVLEGEIIQSGPGAAYIIGPTNLTACYSGGRVCGNCFRPSANCWAQGAPGLGFCDDTSLEDQVILYEESSLPQAATAVKITGPNAAGIIMTACCDNAQVAGDFGAAPVSNCTTRPLTTASPLFTVPENDFSSANLTNAPCALLESTDGQVCFNSFCAFGTVAMACAVDTNSPQMEVGCPARTVMRTTAIGFGSLTKGHQMRSPRRYAGLFVEDYGCMVGDENQVTFVPESCGSGRISTNFDPAGTSNPVTTTPTMVTAAPTVSMSNAPTQAPSHFGSPAFVSEQCLNESMSLLSDPSVANQVLQVNQRVDAINCVPMTTVPPNTFSECNGDFATLQTAFVNACTGAGGNTASLDITMRCEFANGDANTYEINDYPLCFAPICGTPSPLCSGSAEVCDAPNIRPALDGLFLASLERRISGGAECIVNRALGGFLTTATAAPSPSNAPFAATQAPVSTSPTMTSMMPVPASQEPSMLPTSAPVLPPTPPPVATPTPAPILATTAPVAATPAPVPISSQQVCSTQTQTLNNSPALADIDLPPSSALFDDENCDFSSGLIVCMLDYGPFSNNVESACASVGGQFFSSSTSLTCTVVGQSGQGFEYILRDFPSCIGIACDVNQFLLASADDFTTTKEQIEAPGGLVCDDPIVTLGVGGGGSGGGSGAGVASLHLALVFASFGLTFLWF